MIIIIKYNYYNYNYNNKVLKKTKSNDTVNCGGEGRLVMDPEACIPPPQSNGETIEEMAGGVIGV